ncbi:MAG: hypothetical protein A3C47_00235 [Omnitrophica bacterium RIFCSPHIGHO2_02_FULL_51_18]|nr:MAG: hypothetical protein A3C47_00235 [Omnitrophica bacterium RIFCSPHIGHO2_02_FULL_51_18]
MSNKPNLIPLAMIICDTVIDDKKTNKKSLIGLFDNINSLKLPCVHPRLNVFIVLTEGNGEYDCALKCIKEDTNKALVELQGKIHCLNPQQKIELNFEMVGLRFTDYGNYRFDFYCNENLLVSRKFLIKETKM